MTTIQEIITFIDTYLNTLADMCYITDSEFQEINEQITEVFLNNLLAYIDGYPLEDCQAIIQEGIDDMISAIQSRNDVKVPRTLNDSESIAISDSKSTTSEVSIDTIDGNVEIEMSSPELSDSTSSTSEIEHKLTNQSSVKASLFQRLRVPLIIAGATITIAVVIKGLNYIGYL